jgi:hypothetical protein
MALASAQFIHDDMDRAKVFAQLALHLPESERQEIVNKALTGARAIPNHLDRAKALGQLVQHLPATLHCEIATEALGAAHAMIVDKHHEKLRNDISFLEVDDFFECGTGWEFQQEIIDLLVPLDSVSLYAAWNFSLREFSAGIRADLFRNTGIYMPIIVKLGGSEASREFLDAFRQVTRWWP